MIKFLGLLIIYLALNFLIISFFMGTSVPEEYYIKDEER